jgi:hypothetical protein
MFETVAPFHSPVVAGGFNGEMIMLFMVGLGSMFKLMDEWDQMLLPMIKY